MRHIKKEIPLSLSDDRLVSYLKGEEIDVDEDLNSFAALTADGFPIGLVKVSGGRAKNHLPKGLRRR